MAETGEDLITDAVVKAVNLQIKLVHANTTMGASVGMQKYRDNAVLRVIVGAAQDSAVGTNPVTTPSSPVRPTGQASSTALLVTSPSGVRL